VSHEAGDEVHVPAQPVEFGYSDCASLAPCLRQSGSKLRATVESIGTLPGLNLNKNAAQGKPFRSSETRDGFTLGVYPEP
jgi:hypothetical protein